MKASKIFQRLSPLTRFILLGIVLELLYLLIFALTVSVLLLSCTALLTYPLLYVENLPIANYQPLLIFGIPLIYLITQVKRSNERMTLLYD